MTRAPTVQIRRVRPGQDDDLSLPRYMTAGAAGLDLPAAISETRVLEPGQRMLVPTGFAVALPAGFEAQVRPRSGLALKHGVTLANAPGTIDCDYRGELNAILINLGNEAFELRRGERIAQLVVAPVTQAILQEVRELPDSERAAGGFGHTGT